MNFLQYNCKSNLIFQLYFFMLFPHLLHKKQDFFFKTASKYLRNSKWSIFTFYANLTNSLSNPKDICILLLICLFVLQVCFQDLSLDSFLITPNPPSSSLIWILLSSISSFSGWQTSQPILYPLGDQHLLTRQGINDKNCLYKLWMEDSQISFTMPFWIKIWEQWNQHLNNTTVTFT